MPALVALDDLSLRFEGGHHAVEVVGVNAHRLRELPDGDSGTRPHELQRLLRPRPAAARAPAPTPARGSLASAAIADAGQRRGGLLEPVVLVHERAQLLQPRLDLSALLVKKVSH